MGWTLTEEYTEPVLGHSGLVENYISNMFLLPESGLGIIEVKDLQITVIK